jgi:predicted small lipoprotein YifL
MRSLLFLMALFMLLSGCGKKGPLYLPDPSTPTKAQPAPPAKP